MKRASITYSILLAILAVQSCKSITFDPAEKLPPETAILFVRAHDDVAPMTEEQTALFRRAGVTLVETGRLPIDHYAKQPGRSGYPYTTATLTAAVSGDNFVTPAREDMVLKVVGSRSILLNDLTFKTERREGVLDSKYPISRRVELEVGKVTVIGDLVFVRNKDAESKCTVDPVGEDYVREYLRKHAPSIADWPIVVRNLQGCG